MATDAHTPPPGTHIHAGALDGVAQQRECWLLVTSATQPRSGTGNALFGVAFKTAEALGQPVRILTDSAEAETAAKKTYSAYPGLRYSRTDLPVASPPFPPTALFHPLSHVEAHNAWKAIRAQWQLPASPTPYLCPKPYDSEGPTAHRLSEAMLEAERNTPSQMPKPRILLTLASPSSPVLTETLSGLTRLLDRMDGCSIMLCTSPRTAHADPQALRHFTHGLSAQLERARKNGKTVAFHQYDIASRTLLDRPGLPVPPDHTHIHTKNRYTRMLAHADAVIIAGDSWSMASEATLAGVPIYLAGFNHSLAFLSNAADRLGEDEAKRYKPIKELAAFVPGTHYTPLDATMRYVEECLDNIRHHEAQQAAHR